MINVLRYEPRSQHQRFEPQRQLRAETEQDRHIHLHIHLNLTLRRKQGQAVPSSALYVTRIFAALVAATLLYFLTFSFMGTPFQTPATLLFGNLMLSGLLLSWVATWLGGLPLVVSAWRSTPRVRVLLTWSFLPLLGIFLMFMGGGPLLGTVLGALGLQSPMGGTLFLGFIFGYPLLSTFLLTRAMRQATLDEKPLGFARWMSVAVVGGLLLLCVSTLLWTFALVPFVPAVLAAWQFWFSVGGVALAALFAIASIFSWFRARGSTQAHPKDASPFDADSEHLP